MEGCAMGQVLHGSATTTEAIRRAIQNSQASLRSLAKRYSINPKTVATWKRRISVADQPTGPRAPHSTVLSVEDEAIVVPPPHAAAARRRPVRAPADHPSSDPIKPASLFAAPRHLSPARHRRQQATAR